MNRSDVFFCLVCWFVACMFSATIHGALGQPFGVGNVIACGIGSVGGYVGGVNLANLLARRRKGGAA